MVFLSNVFKVVVEPSKMFFFVLLEIYLDSFWVKIQNFPREKLHH